MAATLTNAICLEVALAAKKQKIFTGINLKATQSLRVFIDSGTIEFSAFIMERDNVTGVLEEKGVYACSESAVSWTDLYTAPSGKSAYAQLIISNHGVAAGSYSWGVAGATVVEGEGIPA